MSIGEIKEYLNLCIKGQSSIPERQEILEVKLCELEQKKQEIQETIDFVHWKQTFYKDVLSGKQEYFSYLKKRLTLSIINRFFYYKTY